MKELWSDFKLNVRYYGNLFIGRNPDKKKGVKPLVPTKKFAGIIAIFLLMNFFLIQSIQSSDPDSFLYKLSLFMTFNKPFSVVVAASFMFFQYGILITNEKAKQWIYGDKSYLKQLLIIPSMFAINFFIVDALISVGVDFSYLLGILTAVWLVILSVRLYGASRGVATTIESKWVNVYSPIRYAGEILTHWFIVILLTALSWGYRYFLVLLTLDFLGPRVPFEAFEVYKDLMRIILPFVYISLIFIFTMILFETILTSKQRDQSTRRAGVFDNLTFALITFVMFIFLLYQITLFLVLSPRSVAAVRSLAGNNTGTGAFVFLEFGISMIFLFRIVQNMNKQYHYGVIFFNQEGSLMLFLALVFCQTGSRIGLYYNENLQDTIINLVISYKNLVIPMIIIIVLGLTIVLYYFKPRDTSIFLRTAKDAVSELDNFSETVLKFCRREYIRRGKAFYFSEIEGSLSDVLGLPDEEFINILYNLKKQYVDLQVHEVNYEGKRDYEIDFYSITENFGYESREKALAYLRKQFYTYVLDRSHKKPRRTTVVAKTKFVIPEQDTRVIKYYAKKAKEEAKRKKQEEKEEAKRRKKEGLPPVESVKKEEPKKDETSQKQIQETKVKQEYSKLKQYAEKE